MPRPRLQSLTFLIVFLSSILLSACGGLPILPGGFDCEEMLGASLRAMLGTDASSLDAVRNAIHAQFPGTEPIFHSYPPEAIHQATPPTDYSVRWSTTRREYLTIVEGGLIDSSVVFIKSWYAGPTFQETIECLGDPAEYNAVATMTPDGPSGTRMDMFYFDQNMVVSGLEWNTAMSDDGQLAHSSDIAGMRANNVLYLAPRVRDEQIDRKFWMREEDWEAGDRPIEELPAYRETIYAAIRTWPETWDEIRIRPILRSAP